MNTIIEDIVDLSEVAELLKNIIRVKSTGERETEVAHKIIEVLEANDITTYEIIESAEGRGNLIIDLKGKKGEGYTLMIIGHSDVVPVEGNWSVDPYEGVEKDGYIYGRGAIDDKGQVAAMVYLAVLLSRLNFDFKGRVKLLIAADEETQNPNHGVRYLVKERRDVFKDVNGAIGELGGLTEFNGELRQVIVFGEKGAYTFELTFKGEMGHGSRPFGVNNPIENASEFLSKLPIGLFYKSEPVKIMFKEVLGAKRFLFSSKLLSKFVLKRLLRDSPDTARFLHALTHITFAKTMFHGGIKDNVLPEEAKVTLDVRCFPEQSQQDLLDIIAKYIPRNAKYAVKTVAATPSTYSKIQNPLYKSIVKTVREMGYEPLPVIQTGTSDSAWVRQLGIPVYHFLTTKKPLEIERIHGIDERIWKEDLLTIIEGYYRLIKNLESLG